MGQAICVSANVGTLNRKLQAVLAGGADVYCLQEVRIAASSFPAMSRAAAHHGYDVAWGHAPAPNVLTSVAPGGLALLVKTPATVRKIYPIALERWTKQGRLLPAIISWPNGSQICVLGMYGFPKTHRQAGANEELISTSLEWAKTLKCPLFAMGDLNESVLTSQSLALLEAGGLFSRGPQGPTTKGQRSLFSSGRAIDHFIVNRLGLELGVRVSLDLSASFSIHYALRATFCLPPSSFWVFRWPRVVKFDKSEVDLSKGVNFSFRAESLAEWDRKATRWVELVTGKHIGERYAMSTTEWVPPAPSPSPHFQRIYRAKKALLHLATCGRPTEDMSLSLSRKLRCLKLDPTLEPKELSDALDKMLAKMCDDEHRRAIGLWKGRVKQWAVGDGAVYKFLRNNPPAKPTAIMVGDQLVTDPTRLGQELHAYWNSLQEWPSPEARALAFDRLEEWFSTLLPHKPTHFTVSADHVQKELKCHGNSSPGLEGWTVAQLKLLPKRAWESLCLVSKLPAFLHHNSSSGVWLWKKTPTSMLLPSPASCDPLTSLGTSLAC